MTTTSSAAVEAAESEPRHPILTNYALDNGGWRQYFISLIRAFLIVELIFIPTTMFALAINVHGISEWARFWGTTSVVCAFTAFAIAIAAFIASSGRLRFVGWLIVAIITIVAWLMFIGIALAAHSPA